jgi:UPF0755 protein
MRPVALAALILLMVAGVGGAWLYTQFDAPGPLPAANSFVVPRGGLGEVADALAHDGVVARPVLFRLYAFVTLRDGPLHAGELAFPAGASPQQVLSILRTARPVQHRLTIPEGLTAAQVARLVDAADALTGDAPIPAEGSLLPQTYSYDRGTSREQIMDRARVAMDHALQAAWDARMPGLALANKAEALTLASIVERETAKPEERPLVAAVFLNRLAQGMKLQSDATVAYGASGGLGALDHGITRVELDRDEPYNTYRIAGLPPGPICMPGLAALRAATQPAASDMLFFVADGTGGHVFARTEDEHRRNVAHWRDIERARLPAPAGR